MGVKKDNLDYNSDEKEELGDDGQSAELISLDTTEKKSKKNVPKLRRPK